MEAEIKFLEIDREKTIRKLENLGAKKVFEGYITDLFFDFENMELTKNNKLLRLRKLENKAKLTFKEKITEEKCKLANELELEVSDFKAMKTVLENLGLKVIWKVEKHRTSFVLENARFEIDSYPGIPVFLEIEARSKTELEKYAKLLGFSLKEGKPWTIREVLKYYKKL